MSPNKEVLKPELPKELLLGYPDTPLGPQVRPFGKTHSVFTVVNEHFFGKKRDKPEQ